MSDEVRGLIYFFKKFKWIFSGMFVLLVFGLFLVIAFIGSTSQPGCDTNIPDTTGSIPTSADTAKNAKTIYTTLRSDGATPKAAAGIMGVWDFESSFNPKISNSNGSGAFGVAQWLGNRKSNLMAFAAKKGLKADSLEGQLKFMSYEIDHGGYSSCKKIIKENDIHKACYDWLMQYEGMSKNPEQWFLEKGASGQPGRYPRADKWYAKFG